MLTDSLKLRYLALGTMLLMYGHSYAKSSSLAAFSGLSLLMEWQIHGEGNLHPIGVLTARILTTCGQYRGGRGQRGQINAYRLHALVLLLLYSGLRIRDAVTLSRDRVVNGKLLLYTAKTGTPVFCPLPPFVVAELDNAQGSNAQHFFWSGEGKPKSCVGDWQRSLKKLFRLAGVEKAHAHRFRHTFAINLLLAGVPLDRVATLLGHASSRITEKHYAPWVRARQEQLEADVQRVWALLPRTPVPFGTSNIVVNWLLTAGPV